MLDSHGDKRLLESIVAEQVERNVGSHIDGVAGTEDDAMKPAVGVGQFALGVFGMDDREERHGGRKEGLERLRRCEDRGNVFEVAEFCILEEASKKGERFVPGVSRNDEGTVTRFVEPRLQRAPMRGDRGFENFGRQIMGRAGAHPPAPCLLQGLIPADGQGELFGKPDLRWHRLLQPLLEIAGIENPDSLPFPGFVLPFLPGGLAGPVARCHGDIRTVRPLGGTN